MRINLLDYSSGTRSKRKIRIAYPELAFSVYQHAFRRLASVNRQPAGETFSRVLMEPVADENDMGSEIVVVKIAVRIFARRLTYHYASVQTVHFLQSCVGVPEVRTFVSSSPLVPVYNKNFIIKINLLIRFRNLEKCWAD